MIDRRSQSLIEIGKLLERKVEEMQTILSITEKINAGFLLDDVLNDIYDSLHGLIPYDRIGFSLLENQGETVRAYWTRSESQNVKIEKGYSSSLAGSSLQEVMRSGKPRIINDLEIYLKEHPQSDSTRRIVEEGVRSSLTCPLIAMGKSIGFLFFSSMRPEAYRDAHVDFFRQIAGQLAVITEKSRLYQRLLELDKLKNKFLGIAAHDLRSPITVIKGYLDLFVEGFLGQFSGEQLEAMDQMRKSCDIMITLINDLLDVSTIEAGKVTLEMQEVDVGLFLQSCFKFNQLLAKKKSIELRLEVAIGLPKVKIDPIRITQVINNLIANAIKFSQAATVITLKAEMSGKGKALRISVIDQGQGIPADEIPKLFEFYGRTKIRPTAGESTTGLGLAISKRLVEAHGGVIGVESQLRIGSTFFFTLPLQA